MANIIDYRTKISYSNGVCNARYYLCNGERYLDAGYGKERIISKVLNIRPHDIGSLYVMVEANRGKEIIMPIHLKAYRVRPDDLEDIISNRLTKPFDYRRFGW